ncbi:MAG: hypothetical protein Q9182_003448, partial [Xanthomendoza sp. 2 TL-2023]
INRIEEMQEMILELLRMLRKAPAGDVPPSPPAVDEVADTDSSLQWVNKILAGEVDMREGQQGVESSPNATIDGGEDDHRNLEELERDGNGESLLRAISRGDNDEAKSRLQDTSTSLQVVDGEHRTPMLLAAHLGRVYLVKMLLDITTTSQQSSGSVTVHSPIKPQSHTVENDFNSTSHREIDFDARDSLGRTVLHYCAEFGMWEEACILLDHGVNVNLRDQSDYPPLYYAIKNREAEVVRSVLAKGSTIDFEWPTTSHQIENLLKEASNHREPTVVPTTSP